MRPRQWAKNVFVLAGLVFADRLFDPASDLRALAAFLVLCAAASSVYLGNDLADRKEDAHHPLKRWRAVASGRLSGEAAMLSSALLAAAAVAGAGVLGRDVVEITGAYLVLGFSYSLWLKRVFLLDVFAVAAGFVLRAAAGVAAIGAEISPWLLCCSFLLALFLALGKRRHELSLLGTGALDHRAVLGRYSLPLLDGWLTGLSGATIVCYALYTQSPRTVEHFGTTDLLYTLPFVIYALFRYQHRVVAEGQGGDPAAALLKDPALLVTLMGWAATAAWIIYR